MKRNKNGSLLLESLLAITIVSVSLTFIIQALLSNLRAMARSSSYLTAMVSLENKMDALIYKCLRHESLNEYLHSDSAEADFYKYSLEERTLDDEMKPVVFKEVKLTGSWQEGKKENHIFLQTYLLDFVNEK